MTRAKQIKMSLTLIAKYDGFEAPPRGCINPAWIDRKNKRHFLGKDLKGYLTSLDRLHPVACKVIESLWAIKNEKDGEFGTVYYRYKDIEIACSKDKKNGEYIDLFESVVDGIVFLNQRNN